MSTPAPSRAVILASHGDRGGETPNAALRAQADAVASRMGLPVTIGMLKGDPDIETALLQAAASGARHIAVYPLFMADGYFVEKLRQRMAAVGIAPAPRLLTPLGLDPGLPAILVDEAAKIAIREGIEPAAARLLIVGHGSRLGPASANATRQVATRAALARRFKSVTTAFLEEEPFLEQTLRMTAAVPTLIAGFFFGNGMHAGEDVPDAIEETGANAVYTGAIGNAPAVASLISAALSAALAEFGGHSQS